MLRGAIWLIGYTGCSGKIVYFPNPLQPIPRLHIAQRDFRSNESVTLIGWPYFVQPITAQCWLGRSLKIQKILGEKHIFFRTPCTFGRRTTRKVISRVVSRLINRVFPTIECSMIIARSALSHKSYITFSYLTVCTKEIAAAVKPVAAWLKIPMIIMWAHAADPTRQRLSWRGPGYFVSCFHVNNLQIFLNNLIFPP